MAAKKKEDKPEVFFVANESGSASVDGSDYVFVKGVTRLRASHPLVKTHAQFFDELTEAVHYDVEQATAAPGEKRGE